MDAFAAVVADCVRLAVGVEELRCCSALLAALQCGHGLLAAEAADRSGGAERHVRSGVRWMVLCLAAQAAFRHLEHLALLGIELAAGTVDVEAKHRHGAGIRAALAAGAAAARLEQGSCDALWIAPGEKARFEVQRCRSLGYPCRPAAGGCGGCAVACHTPTLSQDKAPRWGLQRPYGAAALISPQIGRGRRGLEPGPIGYGECCCCHARSGQSCRHR